jgi:NAD(P)-dependent dehydrogenase (short-subunit alcohol dehydrogenase family)
MIDGLNVLITGTSSGIGRRMAETFARAGHRVHAGMREPEGRNAAAKGELLALARTEGRSIEVVELDVTDDAQVEAAVARAGQVDVLVNNAGLSLVGLAECSSIEQVRRAFEVNYFGAVRLCRAVLPGMRGRRSGLVVHISSMGGRVAMPSTAHYCATKAAIEMLGEVQRYELASFGVDVALVEPGLFATGIFDNAAWADDEARSAEYGELAHKGRKGVAIARQMMTAQQFDPQRVADAVLRLAQLPAGQRPLRTAVGEDSAAMLDPIDAIVSPFTQGIFKAFGYM